MKRLPLATATPWETIAKSLVYLLASVVCHRPSVVVAAALYLAVAALAAMPCYLCPVAAADQLVWQHLLLAWEMVASAAVALLVVAAVVAAA